MTTALNWRGVVGDLDDAPADRDVLPPEFDQTEAGDAARFARLHGAHVRYILQWRCFIVFHENHWQRDPGQVLVTELAKDVGKSLIRDAADAINDRERAAMLKRGQVALSARGIRAILELARGIPGIPGDHNALDADPWLFGVKNGTLDLRTGRLRPADPADLMTMQSSVVYDPTATAPRWDRALEEWFPDIAVRQYVQRLVGAALVGIQRDHVFVILFGVGRNGKGTFTRAVKLPFGPYLVPAHMSLLVQQKHPEHDTVRADLFRVRLAIAAETERKARLAEASVKNLTGGDPIKCRRLYENPWEFTPSHMLWLQTNYLPTIAGRDRGVWSRVKVIPWESNFERAADTGLDDKLAGEAAGILAWAVRGCLEWQQRGLDEPEAVIRATLAYREAEDTFRRFATDKGLVFDSALRVDGKALNALLDEWADEEGQQKPDRAEFTSWLEENDAKKTRERLPDGTRLRGWKGVGVPS